MHKVSVLVATYDRHRDLAQCLQAISGQCKGSFDIEVCVVNDGGPPIDAVIRQLNGITVRYTNFTDNYGQVEARNAALEMASGDLIAICDDDDRWLPSHVSHLVEVMERGGARSTFVYSDAEIVRLKATEGHAVVLERKIFAWQDATQLLRQYNPIVPSSVLYRKSLHDLIGYFDPQVSHYWDWDFFLCCSDAGALTRSPYADMLYAFYENGNNQSANPEGMSPALDVLCQKHGLGQLPVSNFYLMTEDSALKSHQAATTVLWNGEVAPWWGGTAADR